MLMELPKNPIVTVHTSDNKGFSPEEVASRCADKIIQVGDNAPIEIQEQARAYKEHIEKVIAFYMKEAIKSDRTTVVNAIKNAGQEKLAELIRRI
jgi:major membrane immunogen (membrane-anchored lipoprotein)|tara:strand:- start:227 stop:511 length:285 start_codon:yes stop_codon:yes gene_type:complete